MKTPTPSTKNQFKAPINPPYIEQIEETLKSLSMDDTANTNFEVPKMIQSPQRHKGRSHQPSYLQDRGLTCLLKQLGRVNEKIRHNNAMKEILADYEEQYKRELAASLAKSMVASSKTSQEDTATSKGIWVKYFDESVGADFFFNSLTGEASWVDPDSL